MFNPHRKKKFFIENITFPSFHWKNLLGKFVQGGIALTSCYIVYSLRLTNSKGQRDTDSTHWFSSME